MRKEKLCIFCNHFNWSAEEMWGMGSTLTGPMMSGGWAECRKGHFKQSEAPTDVEDYRRVILIGEQCKDYDEVEP